MRAKGEAMCGVTVTQSGGLGGLGLEYYLAAPVRAPEVASSRMLLGELSASKGNPAGGILPTRAQGPEAGWELSGRAAGLAAALRVGGSCALGYQLLRG
jgi:hypothetical protein